MKTIISAITLALGLAATVAPGLAVENYCGDINDSLCAPGAQSESCK